MKPVRGRVYEADLGYGRKPWLVVSNNARNLKLDDCIAVRITTTDKKLAIPSIIPIVGREPVVGFVLCDEIEHLDSDELLRDMGALSIHTMQKVAAGLQAALAL